MMRHDYEDSDDMDHIDEAILDGLDKRKDKKSKSKKYKKKDEKSRRKEFYVKHKRTRRK